jgi:hypothetical protein
MIYVDLSLASLTDLPSHSLHDPTHPSTRNLWSTDIKAADKYLAQVRDRFLAENIHERINILVHRCERTQQCTSDDERILNKIDADITSILLAAERDCKKAKGYDWSPLLANAGRTVIAAKWHLSDLLNDRIHLPLWEHSEAVIQAKRQMKEAYAMLRRIQSNAKQIRETFLEDLAAHLAETRRMDKATVIKQLLRAERQSIIFKRLGIWVKGREHHNLDRILVPDDPDNLQDTTWTSVVEATALYEVLNHAGQQHFRQASSTPFVTGPIADRFGPFADNHYCDAILNGTFDMSDLSMEIEVQDIITGMRYPDPTSPTGPIDTAITTEHFSQAVAHTRERTSSSPSGRHYGHYRTLLRDEHLIGDIANIANFCFRWGITLTRWETVTQPLIPKDTGTPRINRIRRITLVEADLNVCLSELFGHRLMINAEQHGLLHPAQYGSRKGKMAISAVLLKRIS